MNIENKEVWKDVLGYEGLYKVSNLGRVKSLINNERILSPSHSLNGYRQIKLSKSGNIKCHFVHRLVWSAFNGEIPDKLVINHLNEVRDDNRLENLECITVQQNNTYGSRIQRSIQSAKLSGGNKRSEETRLKISNSLREYYTKVKNGK